MPLVVLLLALVASSARAQESGSAAGRNASADSSRHQLGWVSVDGVRIRYLDWGGSGPALVFIPGFGNSAHVFDDFAPRFRDLFRVLGVTRVGFGESDKPEGTGYDLTSRVAHIEAVLDSLGIRQAVLVGHSLGGDEITGFARAHPDRTLALVYLDAAYDHVEAWRQDQAMAQYAASAPAPEQSDFASAQALQAFTERQRGIRLPIGDLLVTVLFDSTGAVRGFSTPPRVVQDLLAVQQPLDYAGIRAPALALYAEWETAADIMPWLRADSALNAQTTAALRESRQPWARSERERIARQLPGVRVVTFHGSHYLFLDQPEETERQMREFLGTIPEFGRH